MESPRRAGPAGPKWIVQRWEDPLFLHWQVDEARLRPALQLPPGVELELWGGHPWLTVALLRTGAGPLPAFGQVNVRTYVRIGRRPGLWFLYIGASAWPLAPVMSSVFGIRTRPAWIHHRRTGLALESTVRAPLGRRLLHATFRVSGPVHSASERGLAAWLLERYSAFGRQPGGRLVRTDVEHCAWTVARADGQLDYQALLKELDVPVPARPDLAHFAERQDTRLSLPRRVNAFAARARVWPSAASPEPDRAPPPVPPA